MAVARTTALSTEVDSSTNLARGKATGCPSVGGRTAHASLDLTYAQSQPLLRLRFDWKAFDNVLPITNLKNRRFVSSQALHLNSEINIDNRTVIGEELLPVLQIHPRMHPIPGANYHWIGSWFAKEVGIDASNSRIAGASAIPGCKRAWGT